MAGVFGQDLYFALYQGGFDPNNPLNNLLATDDDGGPGFNPELMIQLMLIPGNYTLVTTTFFSLDAAGAYSYTVSSASGGNIYGCPGLASPRLSLQESIALGFPPGTTLTAESPLLINICFAADINTENLEVRIANQLFYIGNLGYATPSIQYNAYCRDFVIPAAAVTTDLADGDIDIDVRPYISGGDWASGDDFAFSVTNVSVDIGVSGFAFTNPAPGAVVNGVETPYVVCKSDGTFDFNVPGETPADMAFSITPSVWAGALNAGTGVLTLANVNAGVYTVRYTINVAGCPVSATRRIRISDGPVARLKKAVVNCVSPTGDPAVNKIDLARMFDNSNGISNTAGGSFTVVAPGGATTTISSDNDPTISGTQYNYTLTTGGCHQVTYTVSGGECGAVPVSSTETLYFLPVPQTPMFLVMDMAPIPAGQGALTNNRIVVSNTTPRTVVVSNTTLGLSPSATPQLTVVSNGGTVNSNPMPFPPVNPFTTTTSLTLQSPEPGNSFIYTICISESNAPTGTAGCLPNNAQDDVNTPLVDESTQPITLSPCAVRTCQTIVIVNPTNVNTGGPANAFFENECLPDLEATDICDVTEKPFLSFSCSFISLTLTFPFIEARLSNYPPVLFCTDPDFTIDWQGSLPGALGDATTGGQTIRDLAPPASTIVCDVITYEFCIPLIVADLCIDPIPLGPLEDACDKTIGQFVFDGLAAILGRSASTSGSSDPTFNASGSSTMSSTTTTNADGSTSTTSSQETNIELSVGSTESDGNAVRPPGGSGIVIADTDGDGNFDYGVANYGFPALGTDTIPNNIKGSGTITVRNVVAWPFNASDACGEISGESINLLDILPIAAIPIVGIIIEDVLAAAACNVDLVFTDGVTVEIPVYNNSVPEFANCITNEDGTNSYIFSQDGVCDMEANWSIPVAYDGCGNGVLPYRGYTPYLWGGTDINGDMDITPAEGAQTPDAYYNGMTPVPVALLGNGSVMESGIYQTNGPLPGSDLPAGVYAIEYTAYSCSGIAAACRFDVIVTAGDPVLACPGPITVKNDIDRCDAVVTGLEPRQGISCASVINYQITYPDMSTSTNVPTPWSPANVGIHNDASGQIFPEGISTVTYTMEIDINGDNVIDPTAPETQTCTFTVEVVDAQKPVAHCVDVTVKLSNTGSIEVFAAAASGSPFIDGGSTDNCAMPPEVLISKLATMDPPSASVTFMCNEIGSNLVMLTASDGTNTSTCLAQVIVEDFFEDIQFDFDVPEICLEANNPSQLDFANYLVITLPNGVTLQHAQVASNAYLGDARGGFGITAFAPSPGYVNVSGPDAAGSISPDGVYTPGTGSGFVTVSYVLAFPDAIGDPLIQTGLIGLSGCLEIVHTTFELRQPLDMESPECECIAQNDRIVNLGEITGGLEPYTIQYGGVKLDVDSDGIVDDQDGSFTYDGTFTGSAGVAMNYNIFDFTEDLGNLLVDYTQPTWSFTIVDARGCELFRSGSCDNDDETGTPIIDCTALGAVTIYTRDEPACEVQDTWVHTLPTDNCDVILYTYTIENPDGTIAGPFDLTALLNPDITMPLPDQFYGEYDFEHHSPTENVSTVTYYAEDAVGNFTQCSFTVTVIDDDAPRFINCPEPAVIVDAPQSWCAAFANYSLPLAEDNCGTVVVTQVDDTGLTSGSLFPVGITINTFEAVDETGNTTRCDVKIIVNDYHTPPSFTCPGNVVDDTDLGDCGAVITGIAPTNLADNCLDNLTVVYRIDDANGNELSSGFDDASGTFFDLGTSTVRYAIQDMPLLLITEVTHEFSNTVDGAPATTPSCFDGIQNGDETGVDCGGSVCTSCNCTNNEVIVEILLDNNPAETTWTITEPNNGAVVASGGPYAPGMAGTTVTTSVCLPDDCYDFVIRDAALDGICCATGNGSYTVTTGGSVLASGGDFGTREVTNFCLDGAPAPGALAGTAGSRDALEITNFGSANLDVSCLMIERVFAGGSETFAVPTGVILAPGGVLTIHFGNGHNDLVNNVFYVPGAVDLAINEPTAYIVSLSRSILDVAVMNGFNLSGLLVPPAYDLGGQTIADYWSGTVGPVYGGGIVRATVWDTDTAADFAPGEACLPITIGMLNPGLAQPTPNGANTAIQAQPTVRVECSFTVSISDDEAAVCGLYSEGYDYQGGPININFGECVETIINVADIYNVADVNLNLAGLVGDLGNLTITLISPEGTEIELAEAVCAGTNAIEFTFDGDFGPAIDPAGCAILNNAGQLVMPIGDIEAFNGEAVNGDWILQIGHNGQQSMAPATISSYILLITGRDPYPDYTTTIPNDLDLCGAEYTWLHPILFDNCPGGSAVMEITFEGDLETTTNYPIFPENTAITYFFQVGESVVKYTLTDAAGNMSMCSFTVTVEDVQFPTLTCPDDLIIQLAPGQCVTQAYPTIPVAYYDNCPEFVLSSFPPGTPVPIGDTIITLIITDASGNATSCTYNLTVLEHIPTGDLACIANQNVTLGLDCEATITADMVLSGDDYRCYDNYNVTLYNQNADGGPGTIIATSPTATVGIEQVGQEIIAEVCDPATGLCCWGYVLIEFKDAPEFICPPNATVRCTESTHPNALGYPIVTSCVPGGAIIEFDDVVTDNGMCGDPRLLISRTWTVTDGEGNFATCVQDIVMEAFDLDQVEWPADYDGIDQPVLNCSAVLADASLTSVANLGFPTIDGIAVMNAGFCSAALNHLDERFDICENSFIIFRTWRVINQCLPNPLASALTHVQTIRVEDADGPDLECPANQTISVSPFDCEAAYQIPALVVLDACSAVTYRVAVDRDTLPYRANNQYTVTGLEIGEHTVTYTATDRCGKYNTCSFILTVEDQIAPTASCNDELNVSLGGGDIAVGLYGIAEIFALDVDEGSNDNCTDVRLEVRRNFWLAGTCDASATSFSPWGESIEFYCCDINNEITIELRVWDDGNRDGIIGNEGDSFNTCWQVITPEDKLNPFCYAPENVSLTCDALPLTFPGNLTEAYANDFAATSAMMNLLFGGASGTDNCAVDTIVERTPNLQLNECGWGTITRRFEAWQVRPEGDVNGNGTIDLNEVFRSTNSCSQLITITEVHNFWIAFPEDADADCADPTIPEIETSAIGCDVLAINTGTPVRFSATGDECYKLGITYDVINWCVWDGEYTGYVLPRLTEDDGEALPVDRSVAANERPVVIFTSPVLSLVIDRDHETNGVANDQWFVAGGDDSSIPNASPALPNYGRYIYTQFIKVYDATAPVVTVDAYGGPTDLCPALVAGQFGDATGDCEAAVSIPFSVADDCELLNGAGDLVVSIVSAELDAFAVDANRDGAIKANEFVSDANVLANITNNGDGTFVFTGTFPIITSAMGDNIVHAVRVLFEDGCGNQVSEIIEFDVIDCKGPAPICINGLTVTLMPQTTGGCAMTIWASDFEGSPIFDCTGQGPQTNNGLLRVTKFAIYRASDVEAAGAAFVPSPTNTGLILNEEDDQQTVVYVYGFDEEGNYDYCETYVLVQLNAACDPTNGGGTIAGTIMTEQSDAVEGVEVGLNGGMVMNMTTSTDGTYSFANLPLGGDYSVTPHLNAMPLNGVTTFDLVLMSKHILGVAPLNSVYKRIAADVNRSQTITTLDMIQLRKLILNIDTEFANNTSWRFVDAAYVFPNLTNPWAEEFPELINENNLSSNVLNANFIGVKIGDVNGSAQANLLSGDDRSLEGQLNFSVENVSLKAGNVYTVAFTAGELAAGYQGTLALNGAELVDIEYGVATAENFGLRFVSEGMITTSWNETNSQLVATDVLFSLVLRATQDAELSEVVQVNSRYTAAEAYQNDNALNLGINFSNGSVTAAQFELFQNTPNPFQGETMISFSLPTDESVTLTISDISGRAVKVIKGDYPAGYHKVTLTKQELASGTGVYTYTVVAGAYTASRKMIVQ